jgi:endonuclease-3
MPTKTTKKSPAKKSPAKKAAPKKSMAPKSGSSKKSGAAAKKSNVSNTNRSRQKVNGTKKSSGTKAKTATKKTPRKTAAAKNSKSSGGKASAKTVPSAQVKKRADIVRRRLKEQYPEQQSELNSGSPFEMLTATILSAQCTDKRVNEVTPALFKKYPNAKKMAKADPDELKELIHSTGFYNQKAKSLLGMSQALAEKHSGEVPDDMDALVKLPGVGRKTAWCVLGRYFDKYGIVVDTHFKRLTLRLELQDETDPVKIEKAMDELIPEKDRFLFSNQLIILGRYICVARKPKCGECFLNDICPSAIIE